VSNLGQSVRELLARYMSPISAKSILDLSVAWSGVDMARLARDDVERLVAEMDKGIQLYVRKPEEHRDCLLRLAELLRSNGAASPEREQEPAQHTEIEVSDEDDIVTARNFGRDLCQQLGFTLTVQIQIATVVSELARNIVLYAGRGKIIVASIEGARRGVEIRASDEGPGIDDLETILGGGYRSRTGMGIGLLGSKRLMDEFEIETSPETGTEIRTRLFPG